MKPLLLFLLALSAQCGRVAYATGTVQQSVSQLGATNNWVVAFRWTGDASDGTVPVTTAVLRDPTTAQVCCAGYYISQVEIVPGSPSPTSGYSVAIKDSAGVDALNGAGASLSATAGASISASAASPPIQGSFTLNLSGNAVVSAKGAVFVFLSKPGSVNTALLRSIGVQTNAYAPVFNVVTYGASCGGVLDDTAGVQAAINAAATFGGSVYTPASASGCLIPGVITIPNDGHSPIPAQKSIRLLGDGNCTTGLIASQPTSSGSTWIMTAAPSTGGKLNTFGTGYLEISGMCFRDTSIGNTKPFVYDTNTVLWAHDNAFWGSFGNPSTTQDVFIMGGDTDVRSGTYHAPFGGYGGRIEGNFADKVRSLVRGGVFANGIIVTGNTIGQGGGGDAAIYFNGNDTLNTGYRSDGGVIENNVIELVGYTDGIKLHYTSKFSVKSNNCYDFDIHSQYCVHFTTQAQYHTVIAGTTTTGGPPYMIDDANLSTVIGATDQSATPVISKFNVLQLNNDFIVYSTLGAATKGKMVYCHDCNVADPCTAGSVTGAWAFSNGTKWVCAF